ncbi:hypothetical protein BSKO_04634 [Bryopsis sp. KO-2023]|nr:hypothetical protein BSKO_04634 [Bryopsis sp. KO-2023]
MHEVTSPEHTQRGQAKAGASICGGKFGSNGQAFMASGQNPDHDLAKAVNPFGFRFLNQLRARNADANIVFSPLGIPAAFALVYFGARGETGKELEAAFGFRGGIIPGQLTGKCKDFGEGSKEQACLATRAFVNSGIKVPNAYIQNNFVEVPFNVNRVGARKLINEWFAITTRGEIREMLNRDCVKDDTKMILANAVCFKGTWDRSFPIKSIFKGEFRGVGGKTRTAFMEIKSNNDLAIKDIPRLDSQMVELPYSDGRFSMFILLPKTEGGWRKAEKNLHRVGSGLFRGRFERQAALIAQIPKFEATLNMSVKKVLASMGLTNVFLENADLSGLTDPKNELIVSEAMHRAVVEFNDQGSDPLFGADFSIATSTPTLFIVDRPFLFFVVDKADDSIICQGTVTRL